MKKIILTGFGPFGKYSHNPTQKSTEYFNGKIIGDREVMGIVLPSTYIGAYATLLDLIKNNPPYAIVSTGLSSSVHGMCIESTFRNNMKGKYPDATGYEPNDVPIMEDSPRLWPAKAFVMDLYGLLKIHEIPTEISGNAGSYICNSLGYRTSSYIFTNRLDTKNVLIHVPWTTEYKDEVPIEEGKMYLDNDLFYKGLELVIENI